MVMSVETTQPHSLRPLPSSFFPKRFKLLASNRRMTTCSRLYPLGILSRKWSYLTLRTLSAPRSFSEIQRGLKFITHHTLSKELKALQKEKLVTHDDQYSITPAGRELLKIVDELEQWSVQYANAPHCPPEKECSNCHSYAGTIGAREFVQIGKDRR
jgi:DNA-binding HxlR family transcriptional regulator